VSIGANVLTLLMHVCLALGDLELLWPEDVKKQLMGRLPDHIRPPFSSFKCLEN